MAEALRRPGRRGGAGRLVVLAAGLVIAALAARAYGRGFTGLHQSATTSSAGRRSPAVSQQAERRAHIAVVDVNVTNDGTEAFLKFSLENARNSVKEETNMRFDILQSQDDASRFVLVEMYSSEDGPVAHKGTEHYLTWRESVADLMASPRQATQWDVVYPDDASKLEPNVILMEREDQDKLYISHILADVKPGTEEDFIKATVRKAGDTLDREEGCLRFDLLRSVDTPTAFLIIEVFRTGIVADNHRRGDVFARWRDSTAQMMDEPPTFKKYINHFPSLPAAWRLERGFGGFR